MLWQLLILFSHRVSRGVHGMLTTCRAAWKDPLAQGNDPLSCVHGISEPTSTNR